MSPPLSVRPGAVPFPVLAKNVENKKKERNYNHYFVGGWVGVQDAHVFPFLGPSFYNSDVILFENNRKMGFPAMLDANG